jgi:signal transduction histidine kinase
MKSIRMKLWSWLMLLVVAILVLLWLFQVVFLEQFYETMHFNRIESRTDEIIIALESEERLDGALQSETVLSKIDYLSETMHVGIEILDASGTVLYQISDVSEPRFKKSIREAIDVALSGKRFETTAAHMRFDTEYWVLAQPLMDSERVIGCVVITSPIESVAETTNIIKVQLIYITAILLLLASAIAFGVSKQFSKPIVKISHAAKELSKGNYDIHLVVQSRDEIGQLAQDMMDVGVSLGQIDRLRKELIGNISHELRTPLSIIRGYAETLRDVTGGDPDKRSRQLEIIIKESERLGRLIEDVLSMSQLESGSVAMDAKCFDILKTAKEIRSRFDVVQEIIIQCDDEKVYVSGDENRIEQVLYNLIGNATKHTPSGAAVVLTIAQFGEHIRVKVADKGVGIPEDAIKHIWDRFYQVKDTDDSKPAGSGLGLAIVKAILMSHKAAFGVESVLGQGTTFWFELPRCTEAQK